MQAPFYLEKLNTHAGVRADFVGRVFGVKVDEDRDIALKGLQPAHESVVRELGFHWGQLHRAEQVHGAEISVIRKDDVEKIHQGVDGLITCKMDVLLGIYVSDCGAVYMSDPVQKVIALLHSGKKGTEGNITGKAIAMMQEQFGSKPEDLQVVLSPCIRPPHYEVDIAAKIKNQVLASGVSENHFTDSGVCTASDVESYYSYRIEKGRTGRMLALLARSEREYIRLS